MRRDIAIAVHFLPDFSGAKDKADENSGGNELYIKFSDVQIDDDNEHLILSIHFIDPRTNADLAPIPVRPCYGHGGDRKDYLRAALDEIVTKLRVEVTGEAPGKKKKRQSWGLWLSAATTHRANPRAETKPKNTRLADPTGSSKTLRRSSMVASGCPL